MAVYLKAYGYAPNITSDAAPSEVAARMEQSLDKSLERMRLSYVDLFLLHSPIVPDPSQAASWRTSLPVYREAVRPAFERLVARGRIGAWGVTAAHPPSMVETVLSEEPTPAVAQMIANVLDAPGDMRWSEEPPRPRHLLDLAVQRGVGVMGIRAVQSGALTDGLDRELEPNHPTRVEFDRAGPFRALAAELGMSAATLAYRYALSMTGVDTVVLGVKNRTELRETVRGAEAGRLPADTMTLVDQQITHLRIPLP